MLLVISDRVCGIHHLERPASKWNFFVCLWFVVVTFSTVGYGEYTPNDWPAQTFVMIMIACALILLPVEVRFIQLKGIGHAMLGNFSTANSRGCKINKY